MKRSTIAVRLISFLLIFVLLFAVVTELMKDKRVESEYNVTSKVKGFYALKDNSLDFVFIGSSQLYADIAPSVLFQEFGMTAYDFSANEQPLWISYYYIKEALKHQSPKAILLDVFTVYGAAYEEEGVNHINLDDLPWSINKLQAIRNAVPRELRSSFYFELAKYHDTWNTLDEAKITNSFYSERDRYMGYSPFVVAHTYADEAPMEVVNQTEREPIPARALLWLDKIVELTREEGVDLILIKTPNGNAERQKLYNSVADYALEKEVPFVNMNTIFDGEAHLNILQAEKVTKYMGTYLSAHYTWADKRQDASFREWASDCAYFYHKKAKCELIGETDCTSYFKTLQSMQTNLEHTPITLLAVKAKEGLSLGEEQRELLNGLCSTEDLRCDFAQPGEWCYLALMQGGEITQAVQVQTQYRQDFEIEGNNFSLAYEKDTEAGRMKSGLYLENENYSFDYVGINVFTYDPLLGEIVEFTAFDAENEFRILRD